MNEVTEEPIHSSQSPLDSGNLRALVMRWESAPDVPSGWKPRRRLDAFVSKAFRLAALIEESGSALLPREEAHALREMGLAAGALDHEARRVRADHSRAKLARATRVEARHFMSEVLGALNYLARIGPLEFSYQIAQVKRQEQTDEGLAHQLDLVHEIARANQMFLTPLGISEELVRSGPRLSRALRRISADRAREIRTRSQATDARNRILFALQKRLSDLSATLRYVHRNDRQWLARIARPPGR